MFKRIKYIYRRGFLEPETYLKFLSSLLIITGATEPPTTQGFYKQQLTKFIEDSIENDTSLELPLLFEVYDCFESIELFAHTWFYTMGHDLEDTTQWDDANIWDLE